MSDMMAMLSQALSGGTVSQIASQIGADEKKTESAIDAAVPILVGALDRNTNQPGGAEALLGALLRDHDGSVVDNISGFLGGSFSNSKATAGSAILDHILGGKKRPVEKGVSRASGLDMATVARLLPILAPIVMGALGKLSREKNLDAESVSRHLTEERKTVEKAQPDAMAAVERLLDSDQDGDVMDDIVKLGGGLLGSFLSKR